MEFSVPPQKVRPLDESEVKRFLIATTKGDECFSCGSSVWTISSGENGIFRGWRSESMSLKMALR